MKTRNDLEQNFGARFFNFIIFLSKIILENMTLVEKYQKTQLSIKISDSKIIRIIEDESSAESLPRDID